MNINNAFPSKWLKAGDIPDDTDLVLTINKVEVQEVGQGEDAEQKPVLFFSESEKGLVLNKTNAGTISKLYTPETDNWLGKRIALFSTEVDFGGNQTLAIRIRMKAPQTKPSRESLLSKFAEVVTEAKNVGIEVTDLAPDATDEEIIRRGKNLRQMIADKQTF
jgi:hypothetical protein